MQENLARFAPWALFFVMVGLFIDFRSLRGVLLPASTAAVSLIWTLGIMVLTGSHLNLSNIALSPLLQVLGTAYALHVVAEYYELTRFSCSTSEVVLEALRRSGQPIFITALITVLGFLSLCFHDRYPDPDLSRIMGLREMGLYSSAGIIIASLLSVTLIPALLSLLRLPARQRDFLACTELRAAEAGALVST